MNDVDIYQKKRFGWYYDTNRYCIGELICNYLVVIGPFIGLLLAIIFTAVNHDIYEQMANGTIIYMPSYVGMQYAIASAFLIIGLIASFVKWSYVKKWKKGKYPEKYSRVKKDEFK